jgi:ketosteroid isomerase-like protein
MRRLALIVSLLIVLPAGRASAQVDSVPRLPSVTLPTELDRVLRDYEREWSAGNARALALLFAEDGFVSNSAGWIRGRQQIEAEYARAGGALKLRALAYSVDGSTGYIVGAYGYGPTAEQSDAGKFVLALRKATDGRWLIAADLDNSNRRPPPGGS